MQKKRGQVTLFIIIALVIVVLGVLIYLFWPKLNISSEFDAKNPELFIKSCVKEDLENAVSLLSSQGGSLDPQHYYLYQDEKFEYLCYTNEYYKLCTMQQPFLRNHIQEEITKNITPVVNDCFSQLVGKYQSKGYSVNYKKGTIVTNLLPERIVSTFYNYSLDVSKGENTGKYKSFNIILNNNLYELVSISENMIEWEAVIGDADNIAYMLIYNDLKIQKLKEDDDTTLYILEDESTNNKFQFASRSLAFPPGY